MDAPVNVNDVINPRRRLIEKLRAETKEAPTITANPIIRQFNGLIIRRNPLVLPIFLNRTPFSYSGNAFRFISKMVLLSLLT